METFDLLTLALAPALTPRAACQLLTRGPLHATLARPWEHADLLGDDLAGAIATGTARRVAEDELAAAHRLGVQIVGCADDRYPQWLRETHTPPLVLWVKGTLVEGEGDACVAIVGSRGASPLGLCFARRLAEELAASGLVVVSGLARGIDTAAHRGALAAPSGRTVAILGCGLDRIYPPENAALAAEVAERGALVSEFPLGTRPWKANFPRRNRVIAGWSRGVVVVEAGARSGALSTARAALDESREVMAVPGHPALPQSEGANRLLRDGAAVVRGSDDVLQELGFAHAVARAPEPKDGVLRALSDGAPRSVDELHGLTGLAMPTLLARLAALELEGAVGRLPGALYVRARVTAGYTRP